MKSIPEQIRLIANLRGIGCDRLGEIINQIWNIDFPTIERLHFITILSFLKVNELDKALESY